MEEYGAEPYPGALDLNYVMFGFDDWDFCYRNLKMGYHLAWTDKTAYQHHYSFTINRNQQEKEKQSAINRDYFKKKSISSSS